MSRQKHAALTNQPPSPLHPPKALHYSALLGAGWMGAWLASVGPTLKSDTEYPRPSKTSRKNSQCPPQHHHPFIYQQAGSVHCSVLESSVVFSSSRWSGQEGVLRTCECAIPHPTKASARFVFICVAVCFIAAKKRASALRCSLTGLEGAHTMSI